MSAKTTKAFSLRKGGVLLKPRRFSDLSAAQQAEVLQDPVYKKYEAQVRAGNWTFVKIPGKGWVTR